MATNGIGLQTLAFERIAMMKRTYGQQQLQVKACRRGYMGTMRQSKINHWVCEQLMLKNYMLKVHTTCALNNK